MLNTLSSQAGGDPIQPRPTSFPPVAASFIQLDEDQPLITARTKDHSVVRIAREQLSHQKKASTKQGPLDGTPGAKYQLENSAGQAFPMSGQEALAMYAQYLTPYERDEIVQFETVHYMNLSANRKAFILNNPNSNYVAQQTATNTANGSQGSNSPDPTPNAADQTFNYGFDSEDGDYLYAAADHLNYRYEIVKKLGRGAFGVVLRCIDH